MRLAWKPAAPRLLRAMSSGRGLLTAGGRAHNSSRSVRPGPGHGQALFCTFSSSSLRLVASPGRRQARRRHQIDATPFSHAPCSVLRRTALHAVLLQRVQPRAVHSRDRLSLWREPAADDPNRAAAGRRRQICQARPRPRHHRRPVCGIAVLLVAAAGRQRRARACRCRCASASSGPARSSARRA